MRVIQNVCPSCGATTRQEHDVKNVRGYDETITHNRCPKCKENITAEEQLLDAIFGKGG